MQIAITRTEYVEVPDLLVQAIKAWYIGQRNVAGGVAKIAMMKFVREVMGIGMKEAKDLVETLINEAELRLKQF